MNLKQGMREEDLILSIAREGILGNEGFPERGRSGFNQIHWGRLRDLTIKHEIAPLVFRTIKRKGIPAPPDFFSFVQNTYYAALLRCQLFQHEFEEISRQAEKDNLTIVPLKGIGFINGIYADQVRMMTDIDIFVPKKDVEKTAVVLCGLGYAKELYGLKESYWLNKHYHLAFQKKQGDHALVVELHWGLDYPGLQDRVIPEVWRRIRRVKANGARFSFNFLSPEDHFLALALHNRRLGNMCGLKNVIDSGLIIKMNPGFDWDHLYYLTDLCRSKKTVLFLLMQLKLVSNILVGDETVRRFSLSTKEVPAIRNFIIENTFSRNNDQSVFLKLSGLLYDVRMDLYRRLLFLPIEQFAKYYGLRPYALRTRVLFCLRFFYYVIKTVLPSR